jgi:hypothetical protein
MPHDLEQFQDVLQHLDGKIPPPRAVDPAQVERDRHAYLVQRGRALATDQGLSQHDEQKLALLGELDIIARHPGLRPGLAVLLTQTADQLSASMAQGQHDVDHCLGQEHDHGRLREEGVNVDQDHDRVRLQARTHTPHARCPHAGAGTGTDSAPAPELHP